MNRQMMRAAEKIGRKMMRLPPRPFEEITHSDLQRLREGKRLPPDRVWSNNHYSVQLYRNERTVFGKRCDKLMIRRHDAEVTKHE